MGAESIGARVVALRSAGVLAALVVAGLVAGHVCRAAARPLGLLREQAVVTVALAPLALLLFGQFSVVGLVANLLAIPWVTLFVTPLTMLGVLIPPLWDLAVLAVQGLGLVLQWLGQWPWAAIHRAIAPLPLELAAVLGGALLVMRWPVLVRSAGLLLMLPALFWSPPRLPPGAFEVLAIDVGQGSAVLVRTAGHSLLFDAGPRYSPDSDAGQRGILPLLRSLGEQPDAVVIRHRDSDHLDAERETRLAMAGPDLRASLLIAPTTAAAAPAARCCSTP